MTTPEPETILQPSLHTIEEYASLVLDECKVRGLDVQYLKNDLEKDDPGEFIHEIIDEALETLADAGYASIEENDTLLIYPHGVELPEED